MTAEMTHFSVFGRFPTKSQSVEIDFVIVFHYIYLELKQHVRTPPPPTRTYGRPQGIRYCLFELSPSRARQPADTQ